MIGYSNLDMDSEIRYNSDDSDNSDVEDELGTGYNTGTDTDSEVDDDSLIHPLRIIEYTPRYGPQFSWIHIDSPYYPEPIVSDTSDTSDSDGESVKEYTESENEFYVYTDYLK